jgi:hypothetical protein
LEVVAPFAGLQNSPAVSVPDQVFQSPALAAQLAASFAPQGLDASMALMAADSTALQQALQGLLAQMEDLGGQLSGAVSRYGLLPWMIAGAAAAVAGEVARRRLRRRVAGLVLGAGSPDSTLSWLPGLGGLSHEEP